jgi:hypothetical protein
MGFKKRAGKFAKFMFRFGKRWVPALAEGLLKRYTGLEVDLDGR